jgi:hypothetical protein
MAQREERRLPVSSAGRRGDALDALCLDAVDTTDRLAVLGILKRGDVSPLARQARLVQNWPALKAQIEALRKEIGGIIAADLVMAHGIRGGIHTILPEDDQFELEALFLTLMRAAVLTFVEVRRIENLNKQTDAAKCTFCAGTAS